MKSLFQPETFKEIEERLNKLTPSAQRQWGIMEVAQMMAYCSKAMAAAAGQKKYPRNALGRILGPFFKRGYLSEKPFSKGSPTDKNFIIADHPDFNAEKQRLHQLTKQFSEGSAAKATTHPHSFFGHLEQAQWGEVAYKHLDHHFRQFGV